MAKSHPLERSFGIASDTSRTSVVELYRVEYGPFPHLPTELKAANASPAIMVLKCPRDSA
jgi:hypothetical protein